jgi:deoxyhypusine synthase
MVEMMKTDEHRKYVRVRRVDECETLDELFLYCLPAFGGAFLRRIYQILDRAVGMGCPLTLAISGPVTVSGQHQAWLIPLLETGWVAYLSTTDAVCYHDGHRSLDAYKSGPIHEVPIHSDDAALREEGTIRVTDMAFDEGVLLDQDRFVSAVLVRPEFQRSMTGTELRYLLGKYYGAQEAQTSVDPGLLATCYRMAIPVLVGAPGDGSVFLNSMKLWAMREAGLISQYGFQLDMHAEVYEACAYHRWGLFENPVHALGTVILGGGVPKNYNLQPEPALGQILGLPNVSGYQFDVQIVTAPVTDGSLSSCPPAEAVTWGKVDKDTYLQTTESMHADYSIVMPFLVKALLDNRRRYESMAAKEGEEALFAREPKARGYLRPTAGYRLFDQRNDLCQRLTADVRRNEEWLRKSLEYPLPGSVLRHSVADFEAFYVNATPPWDIGRPQRAFLQLAEAGAIRGRVLDAGCGTGEHALLAASLGLEVTGIDAAAKAIEFAKVKAQERGLSVRFLVRNALELASFGEQYDTVLDSGLFHVFDDADRRAYLENLTAIVPSGGRYFMLCFSEFQPGDRGPRRVTQAEIRAGFAKGWQVDSIEPAKLETTMGPEGVRGWLACLTRV